jgi:WS/DGAT/MGAT family acyltransferase
VTADLSTQRIALDHLVDLRFLVVLVVDHGLFMQQISGLDATFLFLETPNAPMHIGSVGIFDPSTAPDGIVRFKRIIQTVKERAHLAPPLRQRLVEVPFNADFPYWVRDESFDPEFHIRHIALPKPGDWRQLCIQVSRLHARALDRSRPLWELYVIEGLDNVAGIPPGCFALMTKLHHAAIDGVSSQAIATALCDATPEIREVEGADEWRADTPPTPFELTAMAIENNAMRPLRYLEFLQKSVPTWAKAIEAALTGDLKPPPSVPRTRFNKVVSPHRVFEAVDFSLEKIKAIKNDVGGTVNDVVLAICAGALRKYLLENDELPERSLVSMCPINVRDPNALTSGGNQVVSMSVPLHTNIEDAKERLQAICTSTRDAKAYTNAIGAKSMMEMADFIPMELGVLGARVAAEQGIANFATPEFNTVITNVPGPSTPYYSNGAKHIRGWGMGPCVDGNGLFHAVGSYCGEVNIGVSCCRVMMPDPSRYAELLRESFAELEQGTEQKAKPVRKTASTRKKKEAAI